MILLPGAEKTENEHLEALEEDKKVDNLAAALYTSNGTDKRWWKVPHLRLLNWQIFVIILTSTNFGYDSSMLNGLQSLPEWHREMGYPTGAVLGALSNGTLFGTLLATLYTPWMADRFGRKLTIAFNQLFVVLGSILQGLSTNYTFFLFARIIIGLGCGAGSVCPALIAEVAYPSHREVCTTFYNVCWYLGAVIAAWVTYGTRTLSHNHSWRIPSYLQGIIPLIQLSLLYWVPESPRYYVAKDQVDKAREVFTKYHIGYSKEQKDIDLVEFELNEVAAQIKDAEAHTQSSSYKDFFVETRFRRRTLIVLSISVLTQFSGNGLVSYYLSKILTSIGYTSTKKQLEINGCLMIYNLVVSACAASVINRFKRRKIFLFSVGSMLICYIIWTVLSAINQKRDFKDKALGRGVLAFIFLYYCAYNIGANGLPYLYLTEIMPYSHRVKGMNIMSATSMTLLIFGGFVNPIAMDNIKWKYYIVYCVINALMFVNIYFLFVETSGYTLEEVDQVFDANAGGKYHHRVTNPESVDTHSLSAKASV